MKILNVVDSSGRVGECLNCGCRVETESNDEIVKYLSREFVKCPKCNANIIVASVECPVDRYIRSDPSS